MSKSTIMLGKGVSLSVCMSKDSSTTPAEADWMRLLAGTSKGMDIGLNTVSSNADDTGGFTENLVIGSDITISYDGEIRESTPSKRIGYQEIMSSIIQAINAGGQPTAWVRLIQGNSVFTGFMVFSSCKSTGSTKDISTYSCELKVSDGNTVKFLTVDDETTTG